MGQTSSSGSRAEGELIYDILNNSAIAQHLVASGKFKHSPTSGGGEKEPSHLPDASEEEFGSSSEDNKVTWARCWKEDRYWLYYTRNITQGDGRGGEISTIQAQLKNGAKQSWIPNLIPYYTTWENNPALPTFSKILPSIGESTSWQVNMLPW